MIMPESDSPGLFRVEIEEIEVKENYSQDLPNFLSGKFQNSPVVSGGIKVEPRQYGLLLLL